MCICKDIMQGLSTAAITFQCNYIFLNKGLTREKKSGKRFLLFIHPHFLLLTSSYFCTALSLKRIVKVPMFLSFATEALNRKGHIKFRYVTVRRSERWWWLSCCRWIFTPTIPQELEKLPCAFYQVHIFYFIFSPSSESSRQKTSIIVMFLSDVY